VDCNNESYAGISMGNWNRLKTIQKVSEQHTGNNDTKELQKTVMLGTAHEFRRVSVLKFTAFITESIIMCTTNFSHRMAAALYTLQTSSLSDVYL
jgi:hypothetical protein